MTDIEDILGKLDKKTLEMVRRGNEITKERLPWASYGLNQISGGGMGRGKQHTIYGNESAGKSALMLGTIAINQKLGNSCLYIDVEKTFDYEWAEKLGVDTSKLMVSQVSTIEAATQEQIKFIEAGVDIIVIDSRSFLHPLSYYDDKELKGISGTRQIGQFARDIGVMCNLVQSVNYETAIVHISQVRMDLSGMHASFKQDSGKATEHADSFRVRLSSSKSDKQAIKGQIKYGDILIEERIGRNVTWKVEKNKFNGKEDVGDYGLYTAGDFLGVDKASELVSYGVKYGVISKGGAWYKFYGEQFQGEEKAVKFVRDNQEIAEKLEAEINAKSI